MATRKPTQNTPNAPEEVVVPKEGYEKVEDFVVKNWKYLAGVVALALLVFAGIQAYHNLYVGPREVTASKEIVKAQQYWAMDSFALAVYGDDYDPGFQKIASDYGMTKIGKTAAAYAGFCYNKIGEFDNAIKYLKKYKSSDDLLNAQVFGNIGHAYAEKGEFKTAGTWYTKAANASANEVTAPHYHQIAGEMALKNGDASTAKRHFDVIKNQYPQSQQGRAIEKFIGLAEAM